MASIVDDQGYNQGYAWTRTQEVRIGRRAKAILEAVRPLPGHRILELGCGRGEMAKILSSQSVAHVTGVDVCEPFIAQATREHGSARLDFITADLSKAEDLERLGHSWSAVVGNGILHHLYYVIDDALPRLRRLIAPGGRFVFWEPNLFNPYVLSIFGVPPLRRLARLEPDEMAFTPSWIRDKLTRAGFINSEITFRDFLVPIVPFALVPLASRLGDWAEKIPGIDHLAQSLFIVATSPGPDARAGDV